MDAPRTLLEHALYLHSSGELPLAEILYKEVLKFHPDSADATYLYGAFLVQQGKPEVAIPILVNGARKHPNNAPLIVNLGTAYARLGQALEAEKCYRQGIAIDGHQFDARKNLAMNLAKQRRLGEAVTAFQELLAIWPDSGECWGMLGGVLTELKRDQEAIRAFDEGLRYRPEDRKCLAGLGQLLIKEEATYQRAVEIWETLAKMDPENGGVRNNLATAYRHAKKYDIAERECLAAIEQVPGFFQAMCNLGLIYASQFRFPEAVRWLREAVVIGEDRETWNPKLPKFAKIDDACWKKFGGLALSQLANALNCMGKPDEARREIQRALEVQPTDSDSLLSCGFLHLQRGDFETGLQYYEQRKETKYKPREFKCPEWDGRFQVGKTLLVHVEQGFGDTFQFIRYARLIREGGMRVLFLSHRALCPLLRHCDYLAEVIPDGDPIPPFDFHIPLMSLPFAMQTRWDTIPNEVPYLYAPPERIGIWKNRLQEIPGLKIGIAWQGNSSFEYDSVRSVPLAHFRPLADLEQMTLISLQRGEGEEQIADFGAKLVCFPDLDKEGAFLDTAALMESLDLIVSSDTSVVHLAGGLGRPVWLAKPFISEWRWHEDDREKIPWYPTLRMFKQPKQGDWESVFHRMVERLTKVQNTSGLRSAVGVWGDMQWQIG